MRGTNSYPLTGLRLNPATQRPTAREHKRMRTVAVDDGKFDLRLKGRGADGLPHQGKLEGLLATALIWRRAPALAEGASGVCASILTRIKSESRRGSMSSRQVLRANKTADNETVQ